MSETHILVVADTNEAIEHLARQLLPQAGYKATIAETFTVPPPCDVILVHISMLRHSPLAGLQAQRRMGCEAPAILFAPRITGEMAAEVFPLGVRDFVPTPIDDAALLKALGQFIVRVQHEKGRGGTDSDLRHAQDALAHRLNEMNTLSRIGRAIATLPDIDSMLSHIVEAAVFLSHAEEGAIFLLDQESGRLFLRAEKGFGAKRAEVIRQPSNDSDAMTVVRTGQPIMKSGESEHKLKTGFLVRALINVPIIVRKKVIGVLAVYHQGQHSFAEPDLAVLASLADYAAIALDRVNSLAEVEARIDKALDASRRVLLHAQSLRDPIEGIEGQVETMLAGSFGSLNDQQKSVLSRIKVATERLLEIVEVIEEINAEFKRSPI